MMSGVIIAACLPNLLLAEVIKVNNANTTETNVVTQEEIEVVGTQERAYSVNQMGTASKFNLSSMDTPQSVSAITSTQIKEFGLFSLNSALSNAAGINVEQVETGRTYFTSRGFEINNFQVDGLGVLARGTKRGEFDTAIYERIEVVRGANGLMSGAGNPSATVNLIRKRPTQEFQGEITSTYGSWNNKRIEIDVSGSLDERVRARAVLAKQDKESYLDWYELDKTIGYGVIEIDLWEGSLLTLLHSSENVKADSPLWGALTLFNTDGSENEYDVSTSSSNDWAYWDSKINRSYIELKQDFGNDWSLTAAYTYVDMKDDSELFYVYSHHLVTTPANDTLLIGYASAYTKDEYHNVFDIYVNGPFSLAGKEHELVIGANRTKVKYDNESLYDYTTGNGFPLVGNLYSWNGSTPKPTFTDDPSNLPNGGQVKDVQESFYAAVRAEISDDLHITAGARISDWESKGGDYGASKERSETGVVTPYLGAVYNVTEHLMAYASYTEIFTPQSEVDANGSSLDPIDGESTELGLKTNLFNDNLVLSIAVFKIDQNNLAQPVPGALDVFREADGISSKGYELEAVGQIEDNWSISTSFTNLTIDAGKRDKNVENYTPNQTFKLATSYLVPQLEKLKLGANVRWQANISRDQGDTIDWTDPANPVTIATDIESKQDAYALFNIMASYEFNDNLNTQLNVNNVTNEKYLTSLYWPQGYYGTPRSYQLSVNYKL
ncbi:hypothetical protein A9Q81_17375 [Gammaproteobacteria bacterium 42_54_T18]|nr:hypothetical protein A9Q81_17375 [Gammaproteobacteria bacterium 42_54_T18]